MYLCAQLWLELPVDRQVPELRLMSCFEKSFKKFLADVATFLQLWYGLFIDDISNDDMNVNCQN